MLNSVFTSFACATATFACCVFTSARVFPPSHTVICDDRPVLYAHFDGTAMSLFASPTRLPCWMFWPALAVNVGYHCAFAERTELFAVRMALSDVMFETLLSCARRSASASE